MVLAPAPPEGAASREDPRASPAVPSEAAPESPSPPHPGLPPPPPHPPHGPSVLFVGYVGEGYYGFQRLQPTHPTIEAELQSALHRAGAISRGSAASFSAAQWRRAARTDRGVSAVGNVVSFHMLWRHDIVTAINAELPPLIRVFGAARVACGFDARRSCDARRYEYLLPVWALDPQVGRNRATIAAEALATQLPDSADLAARGVLSSLAPPQLSSGAVPSPAAAAAACRDEAGDGSMNAEEATFSGRADAAEAAGGTGARLARDPLLRSHLREDVARRMVAEVAGSQFEFTELQRRKLNLILGVYEGRHSFHNFTNGAGLLDGGDAVRTMLRVYCPGTLRLHSRVGSGARGSEGQLYVRIVVYGSSFMLHQIRKMVGLAIAVARGVAPPGCLRAALCPDSKMAVPVAPASGLIMDEAMYSTYNAHADAALGEVRLGVDNAEAALDAAPLATCPTSSATRTVAAASPDLTTACTMSSFAPASDESAVAESAAAAAAPSSSNSSCSEAGSLAAAFKRRHIYPCIAATPSSETLLFVRGLSDASFGFSKWVAQTSKPRSGSAKGAATPGTAAGTESSAAGTSAVAAAPIAGTSAAVQVLPSRDKRQRLDADPS